MAEVDESQDEVWDTTSEITETWKDHLKRFFDVWISAPFRIMIDDLRTRIGISIILFYILMGTVGVILIPQPIQGEGPILAEPFKNTQYLLGTDAKGRGILALIVHSTPPMLKMIVSGAIFSVVVGTIIGTTAGYFEGTSIDDVLMAITDIVLTIPGLPLVIVLSIALEPRNPFVVGFIVVINNWAGLARNLRSQVLSIREDAYIELGEIMGITTPRLILKDILPNLMPYILINFSGSSRRVIIEATGLYFIGLLPFTALNWGVMLNQARNGGALNSFDMAHWIIAPLFTITLLVYGLIMISQGMDKVFNPRVRARHAESISDEQVNT